MVDYTICYQLILRLKVYTVRTYQLFDKTNKVRYTGIDNYISIFSNQGYDRKG